ncbi:MAG TPA: hypothetical protein VF749_01630, partial [Candidatus Acidoferrum sp.]
AAHTANAMTVVNPAMNRHVNLPVILFVVMFPPCRSVSLLPLFYLQAGMRALPTHRDRRKDESRN